MDLSETNFGYRVTKGSNLCEILERARKEEAIVGHIEKVDIEAEVRTADGCTGGSSGVRASWEQMCKEKLTSLPKALKMQVERFRSYIDDLNSDHYVIGIHDSWERSVRLFIFGGGIKPAEVAKSPAVSQFILTDEPRKPNQLWHEMFVDSLDGNTKVDIYVPDFRWKAAIERYMINHVLRGLKGRVNLDIRLIVSSKPPAAEIVSGRKVIKYGY